MIQLEGVKDVDAITNFDSVSNFAVDIKAITFNGTDVTAVTFNGTTVWTKP